ncbi:hypothetical protein [Priestia abyssalis]|uniref:hypothetical protein n=1 Tax=Priestia abyssalis TaxID=1221450 RepID=UPI0009957FC8|nr:hypothetical protein [Priestia abyssalis]
MKSREVWRKRALYGYKATYVQARFEEMKKRHEIEKNERENRLANIKEENARLKETLKYLEEQPFNQHSIKSEMTELLLRKHLELSYRLLETKAHMEDRRNKQMKMLTAKHLERDAVFSRLKEGLQQLESTLSRIGGG